MMYIHIKWIAAIIATLVVIFLIFKSTDDELSAAFFVPIYLLLYAIFWIVWLIIW
jgi:hypothetical protein